MVIKMNKKEQIMKQMSIHSSFHITGCANYVKRPKNAVYLSAANSIEHELTKIRSVSDEIFRNAKTRQELRGITPPNFAKAFMEANK